MASKFVVLSVLLAVANAGYLNAPSAVEYHSAPAAVAYHQAPVVTYAHAPTAIGSQTQSVYRSADGNHAVSMYSKAVDTPYSSVRKYDTRVSNDAVAYAPVAHVAHAPAVAHVAHAPAVAHVAHAPAVAHVAHAPVTHYAQAPAMVHVAHAPAVAHVSHSYAPSYATSYTSSYYHHMPSYSTVAKVAVSPVAPAVSHFGYSHGYGHNYHY